jgi:hypothetical protein
MMPNVDVTLIHTGYHLCEGSINNTTPTSGLDEDLNEGGNDPGNFSRRRTVWDDAEAEKEKDDQKW